MFQLSPDEFKLAERFVKAIEQIAENGKQQNQVYTTASADNLNMREKEFEYRVSTDNEHKEHRIKMDIAEKESTEKTLAQNADWIEHQKKKRINLTDRDIAHLTKKIGAIIAQISIQDTE